MVKVEIESKWHLKWLREKRIKEILKLKLKSLDLKESLSSKYSGFFASSANYPLIANGINVIASPKSFKSLFDLDYTKVIEYFAINTFARRFSSTTKIFEEFKFLSMSLKPVGVELIFSRKPLVKFNISNITTPLGPRATLKKLIEEENPKIPRKVYSLSEENIKAVIGLEELYSRNFDEYYLTNILSAGVLGKNKRIVPTRWAITAVDSTLSKFNISIIKSFKSIDEMEVYGFEHFSNNFVIILLPGEFEFENFEAWAPKTSWGARKSYYITEEYQNIKGRKTYPYSQAGAYFAVLLATTEFLRKRRRKARIVVIREVSEDYQIPLGVWHVRETVRKALSTIPFKTTDEKELFSYLTKKLNLPFPFYLKKSKILGQKKITDWLV